MARDDDTGSDSSVSEMGVLAQVRCHLLCFASLPCFLSSRSSICVLMFLNPVAQSPKITTHVNLAISIHVTILGVQQGIVHFTYQRLPNAVETVRYMHPRYRLLRVLREVVQRRSQNCLFHLRVSLSEIKKLGSFKRLYQAMQLMKYRGEIDSIGCVGRVFLGHRERLIFSPCFRHRDEASSSFVQYQFPLWQNVGLSCFTWE